MKTLIKKTDDAIVVSLDGKIDHEAQAPFRENLARILRNARTDEIPKKIIFDFKQLEFVGSSGISSFVQTLKEFNASASVKPQYFNVRSEFQKIIRAFDEQEPFDFCAPGQDSSTH